MKSNRQKLVYGVVTFVIMNYNCLFLVLNEICLQTFYCEKIPNPAYYQYQKEQKNYLEYSGLENEYLETHRHSYDFYEDLSTSTTVAIFNHNFTCYRVNHCVIVSITLLIFIMNIILKFTSLKFLRYLPNPKLPNSRYLKNDFISDTLILILTIIKLSFVALELDYQLYRIYSFISLVVIMGVYFILLKFKTFYSDNFNSLKSLKVLYLLLMSLYSVLMRETRFGSGTIDFPQVFTFLLLISFLVRINKNLNKVGIKSLIKGTEDIKSMPVHIMLTIAYRIFKFCDFEINNYYRPRPKEMGDYDKETRLMVIWLLGTHKKKCRKVECFCKESRMFMEKNALLRYECFRTPNNLAFKSIFLLEYLFKKFIKNNKKREDTQLLTCYFHLMLNYLGKVNTTHYMVHDYLSKMKLRKGEGSRILEFDVIIDQLKSLCMENIKRGLLVMRYHEKDFKDSRDFETKKKKSKTRFKFKIDVVRHAEYLQSFQKAKDLVKTAIDVKLIFLRGLSEISSNVDELVEVSSNFDFIKKKIYKKFHKLLEKSKRKYSPLFNIFGHFAQEVCQDLRYSAILLSTFEKYFSRMNLNQVFGTVENARYELVVMYVNAEKSENMQQILYTTSNVKKYIGKLKPLF